MGESATGKPGNVSGSTITLPAVVKNIGTITAFIEDELDKLDCPIKPKTQISIAVDEVIANVAMYAYAPGTGDVTVHFDFDEADRMAVITITDDGMPFNPMEKEDPDVGLPAEERGIGGLGIFLVKKTMDGMDYRRENGKNVLCIRKRI